MVTGNQVFKYFKLLESSLQTFKASLNKKDANIVSQNYTCHCWLADGKFLVATDRGEIIYCEQSGDLKILLHQDSSMDGFHIETIKTYSKGFIVGGEGGHLMIYERTDEPKTPFTRSATLPTQTSIQNKAVKTLMEKLLSTKILNIDLSAAEDCLIFSTEN